MNKRMIGIVLVGLMVVGVACGGGGGNDAESLYSRYTDKYADILKPLSEAFDEGDELQTFEEYTMDISSDDCELITEEEAGYIALFLGADLAKNNMSIGEFIKDSNQLTKALKAEGFC